MLLDRQTLVNLTNNQDFNDVNKYPDYYLQNVISTVEAELTTALRWNPVLQVHVNEEGNAQYVTDGIYAGRYYLELNSQPLVPGVAANIFQNLQLTYAIAYSGPTTVVLSQATIFHNIGVCYCLSPGGIEALAGVSWAYSVSRPAVYASGYLATYASGYSTGIQDPTPNGGVAANGFSATLTVVDGAITGAAIVSGGTGFTNPPFLVITDSVGSPGNSAVIYATIANGSVNSLNITNGGQNYTAPTIATSSATTFNAPPIPLDIQNAGVLLVQERLAYDTGLANGTISATSAGLIMSKKVEDQEIKYGPIKTSGNKNAAPTNLGYGTFLAQQAQAKINRYVKRRYPNLIGGL